MGKRKIFRIKNSWLIPLPNTQKTLDIFIDQKKKNISNQASQP
jgi:hypothetical protein